MNILFNRHGASFSISIENVPVIVIAVEPSSFPRPSIGILLSNVPNAGRNESELLDFHANNDGPAGHQARFTVDVLVNIESIVIMFVQM